MQKKDIVKVNNTDKKMHHFWPLAKCVENGLKVGCKFETPSQPTMAHTNKPHRGGEKTVTLSVQSAAQRTLCCSPTHLEGWRRPRRHRLPEQFLAAAAPPLPVPPLPVPSPVKATKREAQVKRPPLAGDAAGYLAGVGGGVVVGERRGWSGRRVHHRRGPPPARRRPHPLPR